MHITINPNLLLWARNRAGLDLSVLSHRFPHLAAWEKGEIQPTLKQIEQFAKAVHAPVGYFFLPEPPVESIPIPDFRTTVEGRTMRPSPNLLETIYNCRQRQEWYRDFARSVGERPLTFVGSVNLNSSVEATAANMRHELGFDIEERRRMPTWTDALRGFIDQADSLGILVMCNGVVMNNNRRPLDPDEFRGFAMSDDLAPLVFINGKDTKSAQMFTLAHELAHIWLGRSAVSDTQPLWIPEQETERWCNRVAAELLVPLAALQNEYDKTSELRIEVDRLARRFKVSTLVILRRIHDARGITQEQFQRAYKEELERLRTIRKGSGGNFYLTLAARVSKRFARALVISTLEERSSFTEAFRLLGFKKMATFNELGHSLKMGF